MAAKAEQLDALAESRLPPPDLTQALLRGLTAIKSLRHNPPTDFDEVLVNWLNGAFTYCHTQKAIEEMRAIGERRTEPVKLGKTSGYSYSDIARQFIGAAWAALKFRAGSFDYATPGTPPPLTVDEVRGGHDGALVSTLPSFDFEYLRIAVQKERTKPVAMVVEDDTPNVNGSRVAPAVQPVTLAQAAIVARRSKATLERWLADGALPEPITRGGNGKASYWDWKVLRPALEAKCDLALPEEFPGSREWAS